MNEKKRAPTVWALLAIIGLMAFVALIEWLFPPHLIRFKIRAVLRWAGMISTLGALVFSGFLVRHYVFWSRIASPGSPAALRPPFSIVSGTVAEALQGLSAFEDGGIRYRPCAARLRSGTTIDRCAMVEESDFRKRWGERAPMRPGIRIEYVTDVSRSSAALSERFLERLEQAKRIGAEGQRRFRFIFDDGNAAIVAVDEFGLIPEMPMGRSAEDVLDVIPARESDGPAHESSAATICVFRQA